MNLGAKLRDVGVETHPATPKVETDQPSVVGSNNRGFIQEAGGAAW